MYDGILYELMLFHYVFFEVLLLLSTNFVDNCQRLHNMLNIEVFDL